jgi:hypothetical protein
VSTKTTEGPQPGAEGTCEHCHQTRALFRYEPQHNGHLGGYGLGCEWCGRTKQPLLCTRCWSVEREREENDSALSSEAEVWAQIERDNARADFARADRLAKGTSR